jgi:Ser/Thr protein kinase RdoA (MazF antagonist)
MEVIDDKTARRALVEACAGTRIASIRRLDAGYTSEQWVADTDEGPLLVKTPVRDTDPEHLRRLIAVTRRASEGGVPTVRFRAFVPRSPALGRPLLVQEFQEGTPANEAWSTMDVAERKSFARDLGDIVGRLHLCTGPWFGDVLGTFTSPDIQTFLHALIDEQLTEAPSDLTSKGLRGLATALHRAVDTLPPDSTASLTHGDLWRQNIVVRDGEITCLLDFEHGRYSNRFLDFGKLDEHIFNEFPEGRAAFLAAYDNMIPLPTDWESQIQLGRAVHALGMSVYFLKWTPKWAPQYIRELDEWLTTQA